MSIENFIYTVSNIAIVDGLIVEALKKFIKTDAYNVIAGIVAVILSIIYAICYALSYEVVVDVKYVIFFGCICLASWLSAMLGFDKVKQAIMQISGGK